MRPGRARFAATGLLAWCLAGVLFAQPQKFSLAVQPPRPGETVKYGIAQELSVELAPGENNGAPPMTIDGHAAFVLTQTADAAQDDGRIRVNLVYDEFVASMTLNGRSAQRVAAIPMNMPLPAALPGGAGINFQGSRQAIQSAPPSEMARLDLQMAGTGKFQLDIDRHAMTQNHSEVTLDG